MRGAYQRWFDVCQVYRVSKMIFVKNRPFPGSALFLVHWKVSSEKEIFPATKTRKFFVSELCIFAEVEIKFAKSILWSLSRKVLSCCRYLGSACSNIKAYMLVIEAFLSVLFREGLRFHPVPHSFPEHFHETSYTVKTNPCFGRR